MNERRSASLRASFALADLKKRRVDRHKSNIKRLRGRYLFRAAVRRVVGYLEWIGENETYAEVADDTGDSMKRRRTSRKTKLTMKDRSMLLAEPTARSKDTKAYLTTLIGNLQSYKKYPEALRDQLASVSRYQHFGPRRVIIRQNHQAQALYCIVKGEVIVSRVAKDPVTGEQAESNVDTMGSGDMFGEVALLHGIPRSATVTTKTSVDLLLVGREDFDKILRPWLLLRWDTLKDAIVSFNYFKGWTEATIRECCILSKIKDYQPNEVLLGDGNGMVNYVYFVLEGKCRVIQHMMIREGRTGNDVRYKLYRPERDEQRFTSEFQADINAELASSSLVSDHAQDPASPVAARDLIVPFFMAPGHDFVGPQKFNSFGGNDIETGISESDYAQLLLANQSRRVETEKSSISTLTLRDVMNEWREITDVTGLLLKQHSPISQQPYPKNVKTVFMQVCIFNRGACFGLGENMRNRRIVSVAPTRCLLVPRYWLLEHNRANIWERVKLFIDSKYPTGDQLLKSFVENRRWVKYRQNLVKHVIENGRRIPNSTTIHDVPYSIRINEEIDLN